MVQGDLLEGHAFSGVRELALMARGVGEGGVRGGVDIGRGTIDTGRLDRLGLHQRLHTLHLVDHWGLVCPVLRLLDTLLHQLHYQQQQDERDQGHQRHDLQLLPSVFSFELFSRTPHLLIIWEGIVAIPVVTDGDEDSTLLPAGIGVATVLSVLSV